jgi:putative ABC transport system permease protein
MSWLDGLRHRVRTLFRSSAYEHELREEMAYHRELDRVQGLDAHAAARHLGNETWYREEARRFTWLGALDVWRQDVTYAWRSILRNPSVTATIILTLALGLGVNAATFSVLDRLYLRPPDGVANTDDVQRVWFEHSPLRSATGQPFISEGTTHPVFRAVSSGGPRGAFAAYDTDFSLFMGSGGNRSRVRAAFATASYFDVLGIRAAFGRTYTVHEDSLGSGTNVIVLADRFWKSSFGGDSSVIGRRIRVEGDEYEVIGVLPPGFAGLDLQAVDVWIPLASIPRAHWTVRGAAEGRAWWDGDRASHFHVIFRASQTPPALDQRATATVREMQRHLQYGDTLMSVLTSGLVGAGPDKPGTELTIGGRLAIVSFIVLVIACANVINLLLARSMKRRREIAVRLALGISRGRLVRLLTAETVVLGLLAGGVATMIAWGAGTALRSLMLPEVVWYDSPLHWRVVVFAFGLSLLAGLVAGIIPAVQSSNPKLSPALKDGSRDSGSHRSRLRQALLITQAALSVVLLVGSALFMRSLDNVRSLRLGYDVDRLAFGYVSFEPGQRPPGPVVAGEMDVLARRFRSRPGVDEVARTEFTPMRGISTAKFFWDNDSSTSLRRDFPTFSAVSPTFFRATGVRIIKGSTFSSEEGGPKQLIVNDAMAKRLWPDEDAIGRCVRFGKADGDCYTVAAIVENARQSFVIEAPKLMYYLPLGNLPDGRKSGSTLIVRVAPGSMTAVHDALSAELKRAFPAADVHVSSMMDELEGEYRPWRLGATLFTSMGLLALLVAVVGIYGAISYGVSQRTHEFGVRIALGARIETVLQQVVAEGVRVIAVGVGAGIILSIAGGRLVASMLYGVTPGDPITIAAVAVTLLTVAALAAIVPAWRAARVDPITALRSD